MNQELLANHVKKVCKLNLVLYRVIRCATCPFEGDIVAAYPLLQHWFDSKRLDAKRRKK